MCGDLYRSYVVKVAQIWSHPPHYLMREEHLLSHSHQQQELPGLKTLLVIWRKCWTYLGTNKGPNKSPIRLNRAVFVLQPRL